jgi:hypothetical protein
MAFSFGGYEVLADKIEGYLPALFEMNDLGKEVNNAESSEYYDAHIRGALRFSRIAVVRNIPLQMIISDLFLGEESPFAIDVYSQRTVSTCYPIYRQILYRGFDRRDRIDADIGLFSAYLLGRGLNPEEYELELYDKYQKAREIALSLNMSRLLSLSPKNNAQLS